MKFQTLLIAALLCAGCGPIVMIPGGALKGTETTPPADWGTLPDVVQIEFRPDSDPYSINIWEASTGANVYIGTSPEGTRWTEMLTGDPSVRLKLADRLYRLRAVSISNDAERAEVSARYLEKYDYETDPEDEAPVQLFRLERSN